MRQGTRTTIIGLALALAAASTGTTIPSLRALSGPAGGLLAGAFVALHVAGGLVASGVSTWLSRGRDTLHVRRVAVLALLASALLDGAMAAFPSAGPLLILRFVEGATHVTAVMALMIAGAGSESAARPRRMTYLGMLVVIGLGAGLFVGGRATAGYPRLALLLAAVLAFVAALGAALGVSRDVARGAAQVPSGGGTSGTPALLVLGERFAFGVMTVALPMAALDAAAVRRTATTLGMFMLASILAMPIMRRLAARVGVRRLLTPVLVALALALAATPAVTERPLLAVLWSIAGGAAAAGTYTAGLLLVAELEDAGTRLRSMGLFHALGNAGHALGSLAAGLGMSVLPETVSPTVLVAALGPVAVLVAGGAAVWRLVRRPLT